MNPALMPYFSAHYAPSQAVVCYLNLFDQIMAVGIAVGVGILLSSLTYTITRGRGVYEVPTLTLGTRY